MNSIDCKTRLYKEQGIGMFLAFAVGRDRRGAAREEGQELAGVARWGVGRGARRGRRDVALSVVLACG